MGRRILNPLQSGLPLGERGLGSPEPRLNAS
jgi:hypothetical protein